MKNRPLFPNGYKKKPVEKLNINELLKAKGIESKNDYSFLENDKETMNNLLYVILSGSLAYGTEIYNADGSLKSDIDIRVIRMNNKDEILLMNNNKAETNVETDTSIYKLNHIIKMWINANPNVLEELGSVEKNALYIHPYFKDNILKNKSMFLSKLVYFSFGGFMRSQINRFNNKINRNDEQTIIENLMRSIEKSSHHIEEEYGIKIGKDVVINQENQLLKTIIAKDLSLNVLPPFLNELSTMCKNAKKLNEINKNQKYVLDHGRIAKHMCHYIRLADTGSEILLTGEINTYREKDHDLLMSIRNNENNMWLDKKDRPTDKLNKLVEEKEKLLKDSYEKSKLPEKPNMNKINKLLLKINTDIITNNWK